MTTTDAGQESATDEQETETPELDNSQQRTLDQLLQGLDAADRDVVLSEVRKSRSEAKNLRDRLKAAQPKAEQYDRLEAASKTDAERAQEAQRTAETRAAALTARAVQAEVKALAANDFADPEDAHAFLDLNDYVDADGDVDAAHIQQDLKDLLTRKPHLARGDGKQAPRPDYSQGGRRPVASTPAESFADWWRQSREEV